MRYLFLLSLLTGCGVRVTIGSEESKPIEPSCYYIPMGTGLKCKKIYHGYVTSVTQCDGAVKELTNASNVYKICD